MLSCGRTYALFCCALALTSCHRPSAFDTGLTAFRRGRPEIAVERWEPLAAEGDPRAQLAMGTMYWEGLGLPTADRDKALTFIRDAAESGYAPGCRALGMAHLHGMGTVKDVEAGLRWLTRAAEGGDPYAELALGEVSLDGRLIPRDCPAASRWIERAAKRGLPAAETAWGDMLFDGTCVAKDESTAFRWTRRAAEKGDVSAQILLSRMYSEGRGTGADMVKSYMWLRIAMPRAEITSPGITPADAERAESLAAGWKPTRVHPVDYLGWPLGSSEPGTAR